MPVDPIAITGRGCVLPDALDPTTFWHNVLDGRVSLSAPPAGRWPVSDNWAVGLPDDPVADRDVLGGFVRGFGEVFDPAGFAVEPALINELDAAFRWVLHASREALREAGHAEDLPRAGLVLGNLSFPSESMTRFAEHVWFDAQDAQVRRELPGPPGRRPHPINRFHSGMTARLAAAALRLGRGGFALDAACASSLYALKLACDQLRDGSVDVALAGGVNCADGLFVHVGFRALGALSRIGHSRPFDRAADGLLPAEGAVVFTLERLADAQRRGAPVFGVIRGIGLSNDGRGAGLLVPSLDGQHRAMSLAYETAGLAPDETTYVECHATGTRLGDATEIGSMSKLFDGRTDLPVGSVKSNLGHLVTAAGAAGLLKVLSAMEAGVLPPTVNVENPIPELGSTGLRVVRAPEQWSGRRRAGVNAFGFGGNNAHLIVEPWDETSSAVPEPIGPPDEPAVAVVTMAVRAGSVTTTKQFTDALLTGRSSHDPSTTTDIDLAGLHFPPADLASALGQQTMLFAAAEEAISAFGNLPSARTMVVISMQCDAEVARHSVSWRARARLAETTAPPQHRAAVGSAFTPALDAAGVLGSMPNVIANRVSSQFDLGGPAYVVSDEDGCGLTALELAVHALRRAEADAVVVGAVDLSHEPVHQSALRELGRDEEPGDVAVVAVLKRLRDVRRDDDAVLAVIGAGRDDAAGSVVGDATDESRPCFDPRTLFGSPHAARGMLAFASAVSAAAHGAILQPRGPARPDFTADPIDVVWGSRVTRVLRVGRSPWSDGSAPRLHTYSGADRAAVLSAVAEDRESASGPARLSIFCADGELSERREAARQWLARGGLKPAGAAFRERPVNGQVAFVYTNGAAAYPGMGRELILAFPELARAVEDRTGPLAGTLGWAHAPGTVRPHVQDRMLGVGVLGCLHTELLRQTLGITPQATIGHSSGESAAFIAMDVWADIPDLLKSLREADLFAHDVAGDFRTVRDVWRRSGVAGDRWANFAVTASPDRIRAALREHRGPVHLMAANSPDSCTICGEFAAVEAFADQLGIADAVEIPYGIAVHAPEVEVVREQWARLHRHQTNPVDGVRFYSCVDGSSVTPEPDSIAEAIATQAVATVDFIGTVEQAYADGVRIFIENGPRAMCTGWIDSILGGREHLAVAMDVPLRSAMDQLATVVVELAAAGVDIDVARLAEPRATGTNMSRRLSLVTHPAPVQLPVLDDEATTMVPAPPLRHPTSATDSAAIALPPLAREKVRTYQAVARAHEAFLRTQANSHREFVQVEAKLLRVLTARRPPVGGEVTPRPAFDRAQLEHLATGRISDLFGPAFQSQNDHTHQTRMPQPPLLLADRVTGIDAVAGSMGTGKIWTETDVELDGWYLDPAGRMATGPMIEAGQADLLLISWLGIDLVTDGDRVYRLLGCDLTFHGPLPAPGETIRYEIGIDGHARHGGVRLFFFHYDCWVDGELRLTMRGGQAGFFTDEELADAQGIQWDPATLPVPPGRAAIPVQKCTYRSFDRDQLTALVAGRQADCFGPGWELTRAHVRTPRISDLASSLLHEVTDFDPAGGHWHRGYLRARTTITPDEWFFAPHFKNDPCMPGTLILEAGLQAMAFYLLGMGLAIDRDGWRFEPVSDQTSPMRCRGQVTPSSRELIYEIFVADIRSGPIPTITADILCTVDGVRAFHAANVGLRLVPDWPLEHWRQLAPPMVHAGGPVRALPELAGLVGHADDVAAFGYDSLLACAWGRPQDMFGALYEHIPGTRHVSRLPGPPYHFMSRVVRVDGRPGELGIGGTAVVQYDVPRDAWYWQQSEQDSMPLCVLMEAGLQPCGWLAAYSGSLLEAEEDLLFRNLDGTMTVTGEVFPDTGTLTTEVRMVSSDRHQDMIIQAFEIRCHAGDRPIYQARTVFGFFPRSAFASQQGLGPAPEPPNSAAVPLRCEQGDMLHMLDTVAEYESEAELGRLHAERTVDPNDWFFKSHFFQDPVQPGSLGLEAMVALLRHYVIERGIGRDVGAPRFLPVARDQAFTWQYRGQVTPGAGQVAVDLEVRDIGEDPRGPFVVGEFWLSVDGMRIYHIENLAVSVVTAGRGGERSSS